MIPEPALALIELKSVARGIYTTDALIKKAEVRILATNPICPGKYMILFAGEVGPVTESLAAGLAAGGDMVINSLILPQVHGQVIPSLTANNAVEEIKSLGIIETFSVAACLEAADIAAKKAEVTLVETRLANGLGGKAYFVMAGEQYAVEASLEAAKEFVAAQGLLAGVELIEAPHPELLIKGLYW